MYSYIVLHGMNKIDIRISEIIRSTAFFLDFFGSFSFRFNIQTKSYLLKCKYKYK